MEAKAEFHTFLVVLVILVGIDAVMDILLLHLHLCGNIDGISIV